MSTDTETTLEAPETEDREVSTPAPDETPGESEAADDANEEVSSDEDDQADEGDDEGQEELYTVRVDGRDIQVTRDELLRSYSREANYTRKAQKVAEQAKELEERQAALAQQAEAIEQLSEDRVQLAVLERQLKALDSLDWNKLEEDDPDEANRLFKQRLRLREQRDDLKTTVDAKSKDLALQRKQDADAAYAKAVEDCETSLKRDIKGWNEDLATKVGEFAVRQLGWDPRIVTRIVDPTVIKTLHAAYRGHLAERRLKTTQKLDDASRTEPVKPPGGTSPGASRRTTDPSGDQMSTEEWMAAEQARLAAKRKL